MLEIPDIPGPHPCLERPKNVLPLLSCDTHAHLLGPANQYPYQANRSYTPPDALRQSYIRLLHTLGFQRAVLVQPSVYGTDNRLLCDALSISKQDPAGIDWRGIAVVDESVSDSELERLHALGVRGIRLNMLFRGGIDFATATKLAHRISPLDWHLQFLIDISDFDNLAPRLASLPVASVVDHMGHFHASLGPDSPAFADLLSLMREGRTWVKISGPNRISAVDSAPFHDAEVLARELISHAPSRVVFGTDWPHVQLSTSMPKDQDLIDEFFRWVDYDETVVHRVLVDNPALLYSFNSDQKI